MCIENSSNINQNMRRLSLVNSLSYYPLNQKGGSSYHMEKQGFQKDHLKAAAFLIIALLLFKTDLFKNYHGDTYRLIPHFREVTHSTRPVIFNHGKWKARNPSPFVDYRDYNNSWAKSYLEWEIRTEKRSSCLLDMDCWKSSKIVWTSAHSW